jgi:hypothetical protein
MPSRTPGVRLGFWSSVVILVSGAGLLLGIVASALLLPRAMTTEWAGIDSFAQAYRATGGTVPFVSFLAALVS